MFCRSCLSLVVALCALPVLAACGPQDPASRPSPDAAATESSDFGRFVPVGDDEGRFETAITTYEGPNGARVSLIASVHIADAAHYEELQREFENYDVLLYELVSDPDRRPKPGDQRSGKRSLISLLQTGLKNGLDLEFQLNAIDYTPANFVHADLTPDSFRQKMEERGETFMTIVFRMMSREMKRLREEAEAKADADEQSEGEDGEAEPNAAAMFDLVSAFQRREGRHTMRLMFAQQIEQMEALAAGADPDNDTVLLEGRNERALEVLREQLALGKKKLAIYYGGAHMPGIERSLVTEMGFEKVGERWLCAWDITKRLDPDRKKKGDGGEEKK